MKRLNLQDIRILSVLRNNARESISKLGKSLQMPHSTIHDRVKSYERGIIKKHTAILDYSKMGFDCRVTIALKLQKYQTKELHEFIKNRPEVNNAFEINHGYDILMDCVFRSKTEMKLFLEELHENFEIQEKHVFEMYNDLKREAFMEKNFLA